MPTAPYDKYMHAGAPDGPFETANGARAAYDPGATYDDGTIGDGIQQAGLITYLNQVANQTVLTSGTDPNNPTINIGTAQDIAPTSNVTFNQGTFTGTLKGLGTTGGDDAAVGYIGEYQSDALASPGIAITSLTTTDIATLDLTPGDWDVQFASTTIPGGQTISAIAAGVSLQSGTLPTDENMENVVRSATVPAVNPRVSSPVRRISISAPTTVYGVVNILNGGAGVTAFGTIRARRVR